MLSDNLDRFPRQYIFCSFSWFVGNGYLPNYSLLFVIQYVMIVLNGGVPISFAGTEEPAAYGEVISIGGLGPSVNGKLSSTIAEILQLKLSIDASRFYIKFYDVQVLYIVFWCLLIRVLS